MKRFSTRFFPKFFDGKIYRNMCLSKENLSEIQKNSSAEDITTTSIKQLLKNPILKKKYEAMQQEAPLQPSLPVDTTNLKEALDAVDELQKKHHY